MRRSWRLVQAFFFASLEKTTLYAMKKHQLRARFQAFARE
jgi:hypothetical protein